MGASRRRRRRRRASCAAGEASRRSGGGYLTLGLVVGIAGLAVVMVRAVRERRRQIGAFRAIGFGAATLAPAVTASRIKPAVALRLTD